MTDENGLALQVMTIFYFRVMNMNRNNVIGISAVVIAAAALRLLFNEFQIWNFNPLVAVCLFAGAHFTDKKFAFLVPFAVMLVTDWIIGLHAQMLPVYLSYGMIVGLGILLSRKENVVNTLGSSLVSTLVFFLITNLTIWYASLSMYPHTIEGQLMSYTAALPFLRNALVGDLTFTTALFGGWYLINRLKPSLINTVASR